MFKKFGNVKYTTYRNDGKPKHEGKDWPDDIKEKMKGEIDWDNVDWYSSVFPNPAEQDVPIIIPGGGVPSPVPPSSVGGLPAYAGGGDILNRMQW